MKAHKILLCEDEANIISFLRVELEFDDFSVDVAVDGDAAMRLFAENSYDLILLDVMLPEKNGLEILREIRKTSTVPVIILTARKEVYDKVAFLNAGADDYVTKPFDTLELIARIKRNIERAAKSSVFPGMEKNGVFPGMEKSNIPPRTVKSSIPPGTEKNGIPSWTVKSNISPSPGVKESNTPPGVGKKYNSPGVDGNLARGLYICTDSYRVFVDENEVKLTKTEFEILAFLYKNAGKVKTRDEIIRAVFGDFYGESNIIDVNVKNIRAKLATASTAVVNAEDTVDTVDDEDAVDVASLGAIVENTTVTATATAGAASVLHDFIRTVRGKGYVVQL